MLLSFKFFIYVSFHSFFGWIFSELSNWAWRFPFIQILICRIVFGRFWSPLFDGLYFGLVSGRISAPLQWGLIMIRLINRFGFKLISRGVSAPFINFFWLFMRVNGLIPWGTSSPFIYWLQICIGLIKRGLISRGVASPLCYGFSFYFGFTELNMRVRFHDWIPTVSLMIVTFMSWLLSGLAKPMIDWVMFLSVCLPEPVIVRKCIFPRLRLTFLINLDEWLMLFDDTVWVLLVGVGFGACG